LGAGVDLDLKEVKVFESAEVEEVIKLSSNGWDIFPFLAVKLGLVNPGIQQRPEV
jgi:hypothetical protein